MGLLGKILLTLVVIAVAVLVLRQRAQARPPLVVIPRREAPPRRGGLPVGWLASAVVVLMLAIAGYWLYSNWRDAHEVLYLRVVDAGSGHVVHYRAYRGDIGDREFVTTDGTRVRLAETERLETTTIPPARN